ncbi:MAG: hypothetical protein DRG27_03155 [Deltaproteobacteria bacterium]|nr:MAG: hypothetical protein DRG27_03155 [Deltaproteobacteria bacterium]
MSEVDVLKRIIQGKLLSPTLIKLLPRTGLCLIAGGIGSGKSCLAYGILEYMHVRYPRRKIAVFGFPEDKVKTLPDWIIPLYDDEFPDGSVVLIDEAYIQFHSRESMSERSKFIDLFSGLVRQKDIFGIFISQTFRKLDIGILSSAQLVLIKKPPLLQVKMDRSEIRNILTEALECFKQAAKKGYDPHKCVYAISNEKDFIGFIVNSNFPPTFWSEKLSKPYRGVKLSEMIARYKSK